MISKDGGITKRCPRCTQYKSLLEFYTSPRTKDGLDTQCKPCRITSKRESYIKKYGYHKNKYALTSAWKKQGIVFHQQPMTEEIYNILLNYQNHQCFLCHVNDEWNNLVVDHDHTTGEVRGLLCHGCNRLTVMSYERTGHYRSKWHENKIREYLADPPINHINFLLLTTETGN